MYLLEHVDLDKEFYIIQYKLIIIIYYSFDLKFLELDSFKIDWHLYKYLYEDMKKEKEREKKWCEIDIFLFKKWKIIFMIYNFYYSILVLIRSRDDLFWERGVNTRIIRINVWKFSITMTKDRESKIKTRWFCADEFKKERKIKKKQEKQRYFGMLETHFY